MAEPKTKPTKRSVEKFIKSQPDEQTRADCATIVNLMREATGEEPTMWGPSIIGFGTQHLKYDSGREGDWPIMAFSPRKQNLTLYIGMGDSFDPELMKKLGKHSLAKSCLYIKRLSDVHVPTLKKLIKNCVKKQKQKG
ncbi:MAG TPA: DUF1801 domain-containing protein [Pyrinomonadaceae bacterium]|nr:DUF1801 domain-containing protein [Pyrinomonadaceae bacterium]